MEIREMAPVMVFDDRCYLCTKFAGFINLAARGRITMVGHYTNTGEKIRDEILDESALEMFWLIDKKCAYGGRAALYPLAKAVLGRGQKRRPNTDSSCGQGCKTAGAVFARSASLLTNSKRIDLC
ncbi:MAG: hypothetical protein EB829_04095 [Nitrosopumilus sp. H8]|nr:MAG: hypothetical protein EB830_00975 [Nitrosopumilus sp. H13]RNJ78657.1 MAG: hypothetical protein EB829_04095 [Nitrosopumilus sp. H8]